MKLCIKCNSVKDDNDFYSPKSTKYRDICKKCQVGAESKYRSECPEEFSLRKIKIKLLNPKGDSMEQEKSIGKKIYNKEKSSEKSIAKNSKLNTRQEDSGFDKSFGKFYEETCEKENCGADRCKQCRNHGLKSES